MVYLLWLRLFAVLIVAGGHLSALPEPSLSPGERWVAFKIEFNRTYPNQTEHDRRKQIFFKNLAEIEQHNAEYDLSNPNAPHFKLSLNEFSDWSEEELFSRRHGLLPRTNFTPIPFELPEFTRQSLERYPRALDLRKKGYVTKVKNQYRCGSCYAFSAVGALEGQIYRRTNKLISLSPQNLVDCSQAFSNNGCKGGHMINAFEYVKMYGIATEEAYPYKGQEGPCEYVREMKGNLADVVGFKSVSGEAALVQALNEVGPISVGYNASKKFSSWYKSSDVYNLDPDCSPAGKTRGHAMLLVGYGVQNGEKYWLVKNSWGEEFGEFGYGKILRGKNLCGIEEDGSYPIVD